ncbi:MAG: M20/M25/M40 family metallo-hydrolase [Thermoanaerobaculia bacterium]
MSPAATARLPRESRVDLPGSGLPAQGLEEEALELLRAYLRFATVNDPQALSAEEASSAPWKSGSEAEAARWLAEVLAEDGIEAELEEVAPGRLNLVARLAGHGSKPPLTLLSHSDVVPAPRAEWSRGIDPFGAEVHDGFLYGRGVLDLKGLGILQLMALKVLRRSGAPLARDVVQLVVADEEAGGRFGADWLLARRPELAETACVLGEGAYSIRGFLPGGRAIQAIAVGEKGYLELELTAEEPAHHSSMPGRDNATSRLIRALDRLLARRPGPRITPLARRLFAGLAEGAAGPARFLLRHPGLAARLAPGHLVKSNILRSMVEDTVAVTVLAAGGKHNVVPGQARAVLSFRLLPETRPEELVEEVHRALGDSRIRIHTLMVKQANLSSWETPDFRTLAGEADGDGALVLPILSPGASDARFWRFRGCPAYGWIPFVIPAEDLHSVHGPDERLELAAFRDGLHRYLRAVFELATVGQGGAMP